jgi:hypothetical protein
MRWATFWAILSQTHQVTLFGPERPDAFFLSFFKLQKNVVDV